VQGRVTLSIFSYLVVLGGLAFYSYGFVDPNLVFSTHPFYHALNEPLFQVVFFNRPLSTAIFALLVLLLFSFYILLLRKKFGWVQLRKIVILSTAVLLFSYPAFSHDIFNYIFTAKIAFFYRENPYIVMPIEFGSDPNLAFTRAANKVALYGPSWIALTILPHLLGFGNTVATIFSFKLLTTAFFIGTVLLIYLITKNIYSVTLFALNPLVTIETLVSSHNDIVMMFFALLAFYFLKRRIFIHSFLALLASILIKYATVALLPVFGYTVYLTIKKKKINWDRVYIVATLSMLIAFLTAPFREEFYPWYVVWMVAFAVLTPQKKFLLSFVLALSFGSLLRYVPVLYTGSYFGITPMVKEILMATPVIAVGMFWLTRGVQGTFRNGK